MVDGLHFRPRVCLITTGQPSTNPRLVKEADALSAAGYDVQVVAAHWADWAWPFDRELMASRAWSLQVVDWRRAQAPWLFWKSRLRHRAARALLGGPGGSRIAWRSALSRVTPELVRAASAVRADLYIAHNLGALPAAKAAAKRWNARIAFDAEDFHSGALSGNDARLRTVFERIEQRLLPSCDYVTVASPLIGEAYARLADVPAPACILNVFPLSERPAALRAPDPTRPVRLYWFSQTIGAERGLEDAVRAMGRLREWPIELHLRGAWQAGYREALLTAADEAGLARDRIVGHEPASPASMARLAADHDIGLALEPGRSVNNDVAVSNKIFTYLLAGTAVVATSTRGQASMMGSTPEVGFTYPPGDVEALVAGLRAWMEHPDRLETARRAAWTLGETRYNWDLEQHKFLEVVRGVLARRRVRAAAATAGGSGAGVV